jgi:SAM-dependent methyltransferase
LVLLVGAVAEPIPAPIPDRVQVAYSKDGAVWALCERQAAADWRTFLTHRGRELRPGGKLVILTMARIADSDFGYRPILEAMYAALLDLVGAGFLSAEELHRMAIPTVGRSLAELEAPFAEARFADLLVENAEMFMGVDLIWDRFEHDRDARASAPAGLRSRASVLPTLALGLDRGASDLKVAAFLDRTEAGMVARLATAPEKVLIPLGLVVLRKA